ncbi:UNVERIFIED_ORG: hypothetical protein GGD51_000552 [Rhizobium esperanzae]
MSTTTWKNNGVNSANLDEERGDKYMCQRFAVAPDRGQKPLQPECPGICSATAKLSGDKDRRSAAFAEKIARGDFTIYARDRVDQPVEARRHRASQNGKGSFGEANDSGHWQSFQPRLGQLNGRSCLEPKCRCRAKNLTLARHPTAE